MELLFDILYYIGAAILILFVAIIAVYGPIAREERLKKEILKEIRKRKRIVPLDRGEREEQ